MNRLVCTASRVVLTLAALCGTALNAQAQATLAKVAETDTLRLGYRESSVPFSYLDNGKPIGFSVDICDKVADAIKAKLKKPNLKIERQPVTSLNRIPLVMNGTVHLECGSTTNNTVRSEQVAFAINYFYTGTRLVVKKSLGIKGWADLKGKTIASTSGTTNNTVLRKYFAANGGDVTVLTGKDHAESFLMAETDRVVGFAMDDILLFGLVANAKNPGDWDVVGDPLQVEPYAIMLPKGDAELKKVVDDTLTSLIKSGEFEKLYKKWFQSPIPPTKANLNLPMSKELQDNLKNLSDKPAV